MIALRRQSALITLEAAAMSAFRLSARGEGQSYSEFSSVHDTFQRKNPTYLKAIGGRIDIVFAESRPALDQEPVFTWINHAASAVSTYFGRYPVPRHRVLIVPQEGDQVGHATTWSFGGRSRGSLSEQPLTLRPAPGIGCWSMK